MEGQMNISVAPDNDFESRMMNFLMENHFLLGVDFQSFEQVKWDAREATECYEMCRRNGLDVTQAIEYASGSVNAKFGISAYDAIAVLWKELMELPENLDLSDMQSDEIYLLVLASERIFEGVERMPYGLSIYGMNSFGLDKLTARGLPQPNQLRRK